MLNSKIINVEFKKKNQINATYKAQGVLTDILPSMIILSVHYKLKVMMNRSNHFKRSADGS